MELITTTKEQAEEIISKYNLKSTKITSIEKTGEKPVWDVTLIDNLEVPYSIITNGIVTHNSSSPDYVENIMKSMQIKGDIQHVFGLRDSEGNWVIKPRVRYYQPGTAEAFFDSIAKLLRTLPDIKMVGDKQYYVYVDDKKTRAALKDKIDEKLTKRTGMLYVETTTYVKHQALFIVDSYPAMLPEKQDEDDPGSAMAVQARMFSEQIKRIKSKLKPKKVTVIGINQLRLRPAVMFGNPEYEPCGEALKLFCFHKDTLLFTSKGILTGEQAFSHKPKAIGSLIGKEKYENYSNMGIHPICKVSTELGYALSGRHEHKVFALKQGKRVPEWTNIVDLSQEYYVPVKYGSEIWNNKQLRLNFSYREDLGQGLNNNIVDVDFPTRMTPELARLIGYLIGEGHLRDGRLIFSNTDKDIFDDFYYCLKYCFNFSEDYLQSKYREGRPKGRTKKGKRYNRQYGIDLYSMKLDQFFNYLGINNRSSREKEVPWCILQADRECICAFLASFFDGEGSTGSREIKLASSSSKLLSQVHLLLLNLGIVSRLHHGKANWLDKEFLFNNKYSTIQIYGDNISKFIDNIELVSSKKTAKLNKRLNLDLCRSRNKVNYLPPLFYWRELKKKVRLKILDLTGHDEVRPIGTNAKRHLSPIHFTKDLFKQLRKEIKTYRTEQERNYSNKVVDDIEELINYTKDNNIIWTKVKTVKRNLSPDTTYDCTMLKSHTILTNGIVSHNSDARIRCASRAIPGGKGQIEEEPSVTGEGKDIYRYVNWRAIKNKLGQPNLEGWGRIWVSDNEGKGRGFDPVFDTYEYLKMTGQIAGSRNKLTLGLPQFKNLKTKLTWMQFKTLVIGSKQQVIDTLKKIGYKDKAFNIRRECFKQFHQSKNDAMTMFFEKRLKNVDMEDSDEE